MSRARAWVAAVTCGALISGGCAGRAWTPATAVADPGLQTGALAPRSIDILPLDLEVWGEPGVRYNVEQVRMTAESLLVGAITQGLYARGLAVGAVMDWSGAYVGADGAPALALAPPDLAATVDALARYSERAATPPAVVTSKALYVPERGAVQLSDELPVPYLPARLGVTTGADATLYVGGWGFAGEHHAGTGEKIAKGIGIGLLVVAAIVVIVALEKAKIDPLGKLASGATKAGAKLVTSAGRAALRAGNVLVEVGKTTVRLDDSTGGLVGDVIDAMGHAHAASDASGEHPDWSAQAGVPHRGSSEMFVEMTLVDNHTGLVLWHAHQRLPADPRRGGDLTRVARTLLATFPAAR